MVKYLNYKEEKLPVRLSYKMFQGMKQDVGGVDLTKLQSMDPIVMESMLWHGLISGHKHDNVELKLKKTDMEEVLEECMMEFFRIVPLFFPKAKVGNGVPNLSSLPGEEEQTKLASEEEI